MKVLAPGLDADVGEIDANQGEVIGQDFGMREIIERRHHQALGQIAAGAENHHRAGIGGAKPQRRRALGLRG